MASHGSLRRQITFKHAIEYAWYTVPVFQNFNELR